MNHEYEFTTECGTHLVCVPEKDACDGCWGDGEYKSSQCYQLPSDCSDRKIIWVKKTKASTVKAAILKLEGV